MRGSVLAHRLERAQPWRAQAGCALAIGLFLSLFGGGICWLSIRNDDYGLPLIVGGGFALVGVVLIFSGIHQRIASTVAETIFELDTQPLGRGRSHTALVLQDGPLDLQSLRANLVCLVYITQRVRREGREEKSVLTKQLWDTNLLDVGAIDLRAGERQQWDVVIDVPRDAKPTGEDGEDRRIEWRIEIWGRVRRRPDFMHPFIVHVE
ncbi:MAG TPA: hypothetical protein VEK57_26075 [Thermoanaerobaculia bacterium]|nr:hypothetical protein [Thermoanaerobaculia bacterium]